MKKVLLVLAVASIPTAAFAQGAFDGGYVGVSGGYVNGKERGIELYNGTTDDWTEDTSPKGGAFGVLGGYDWQLRNVVLGVEGDYEKRSMSDHTVYDYRGVPSSTYPLKTEGKAAYSLRANLGYQLTTRTLAYVTGGYAAVQMKRTFTDTSVPVSMSDTTWQHGWTAGLGVEQLVTTNVAVKLEYRYAEYREKTIDVSSLWSATAEQQKYKEQSARLVVAYRF